MKPKILFISHSYPPTLGGVESQNFNLAQNLKKKTPTKIIANGNGKLFLPLFIPWAFFRSFFIMMNYDICLVGNGVLAPVAAILKFFHPRKKFFSIVHGLDITFASKKSFLSWVYKKINLPSLKKLDKLFMVSNFTLEVAVSAGIPRNKCIFIPNGAPIDQLRQDYSREKLSDLFGENIDDKKVILRLARFVPHKGTDWFIRNVMPELGENVVMIATGYRVSSGTAGDPDNFQMCEKAIQENQLANRVKLMPNLEQSKLEILLNTVDLVVSPNVEFPGSSEGFGINVIEAAACERVVVASNLQGLSEAIKDGKNGFLVEPENTYQWVKKINAIFSAGPEFAKNFGKLAASFVRDNFSWEKIAQKYLEEMRK